MKEEAKIYIRMEKLIKAIDLAEDSERIQK